MRFLFRPAAALLFALPLITPEVSAQNESGTPQVEQATSPVAAGGLRAYLDPATGRLIDHPPYGRPTLEMNAESLYPFTTSHLLLFEQEVPNGAFRMDLQGRFRSGTVATVTQNDEIEIWRFSGEMFLTAPGRKVRAEMFGEPAPAGEDGS